MTDDTHLLRQFATDRDEPAFAELVRRHVDLVYSAALRQLGGDHHRAQEVTQMVFTDLSRKAAALVRHPVLPAWLHRSTYFAALRLRRSESRRQRYEAAAGRDPVLSAGQATPEAWEAVRPVLDEAIDGLDERDRRAIVLRYFSSAAFGELGRQLGLNENAARMRVERALGKLRERLERKGIKSSSGALAAALTGHAISAAPSGVGVAVTNAAVAGAGTAAGTWLAFMSSSKLPISLAATVILGSASMVTLQERANRRASDEVAAAAAETGALSALAERNQQMRTAAQETLALQKDGAGLPALRAYAKVLEARASPPGPAPAASQGTARTTRLDDGQSVFDIAKLDQRPKALRQIRPQYPTALRDSGVSGEALVDFVVGSDGRVYNAYAVSGTVNGESAAATDSAAFEVSAASRGNGGASPEPPKLDASAFENAAVQAVNQWTFQPGQMNGQSVNTHMQVPIVFSIASAPPPTAATWF